MGKIIWLASYPKSGNTWTRAFLSKYLGDADDELDINHLASSPISSSRLIFDLAAGVEAACLLPAEIDNLRAPIFRLHASQLTKTRFMKTHEAWRCTDAGAPIFPADMTHGVVYIVRNPLDVAVSSSYHYATTPENAVTRLNDPNFMLVETRDGIRDQIPQLLYSWSGHVQSWLDDSGLPTLLMRYEDMLADPISAFSRLVSFSGLEYDTDKVAEAVQATAFETLRRQERDKGFRERPQANKELFFREGRTGGWRDRIAQELVESILATHAPTMHRLGYLDAQGNITV